MSVDLSSKRRDLSRGERMHENVCNLLELIRFGGRTGQPLCVGSRFGNGRTKKFPIEHGDESDADGFGTNRFTLVLISTRPESFAIHRGNHGFGTFGSLRLALGKRGQ